MEIKKLKELAGLMQQNDLSVLEIKEGDTCVRLERRVSEAAAPVEKAAAPAAQPKADGTLVTAPTVGVFYASPSPESKPFVQVGDQIRQGDTLCIIEAMKLMNEIPADLDGTVAEICVDNGEVVEFGQPLFRIV